jgi:plasmid stabilization system protein ParE
MAYRVSLSAPAETDAYAAFERIREAAPTRAEKWLIRLFQAILSLDQMPARCSVIPEAEELGYDARHLLY